MDSLQYSSRTKTLRPTGRSIWTRACDAIDEAQAFLYGDFRGLQRQPIHMIPRHASTLCKATVRAFFVLLAALLSALPSLAAETAGPFPGKTVRIIVGASAGGGYDAYSRLVAAHLGKNLPGNPAVIVQNMTGAGSLIAANYITNVAPKDGTVIGAVNPAIVTDSLFYPTASNSTRGR